MIYVNCGCGKKYSTRKEWINLDFFSSDSNYVKKCNILKGLPFEKNSVDAIYSSCMLEHFSKKEAVLHVDECYRVLKEGGTVRIVVPDLENICREYLRVLELCKNGANIQNEYEYILIELLDQMTRTNSGGLMKEYWINNKDDKYVQLRTGYPEGWNGLEGMKRKRGIRQIICKNKYLRWMKNGKFINSGEVHKWMYDSYGLSDLLKNAGFKDICVCDFNESRINNWTDYKLEINNEGNEYKPNCLYVEAIK